VRLVLVLVLGLGLVAPVLLALAWFRFAGGRFGWLLTALAFGAYGAVLGWLAVSKHWPRGRRDATVALATFGVIAGFVVAHFAPPTPGRLRDAIDDVVQPNWTLVSEDESGNVACFDECLSVSRQYRVDGDLQAVSTQIEDAVKDLQCPPPDVNVRVRWSCRHGDDITVTVELTDQPALSTVYVSATSG